MRKNLKVVTIMEQNQTSWENFFRNDSSNMLEILANISLRSDCAALFSSLPRFPISDVFTAVFSKTSSALTSH